MGTDHYPRWPRRSMQCLTPRAAGVEPVSRTTPVGMLRSLERATGGEVAEHPR